MKLGVNIDHVATLRQARRGALPDPVAAASIAELAGAAGITAHLREDRRHIQDRDIALLMQTVTTKLNLEMSVADPIVRRALEYKPQCACLVPERREELTTEGGLDVRSQAARVKRVVTRLQANGTTVSLFIAATPDQISAAADTGAVFIEFHTGSFADATNERMQIRELAALVRGAEQARTLGLRVNAGHGLNYHNVHLMHHVPYLEELNIGHSIIARAVLVGLDRAVRDMTALVTRWPPAPAAHMSSHRSK